MYESLAVVMLPRIAHRCSISLISGRGRAGDDAKEDSKRPSVEREMGGCSAIGGETGSIR